MLPFTAQETLAIVVAGSFAAGLNVYATVATLGLLSHFHAFQLPPALSILNSWPIIVACVLIFGIEFFADKVPIFDLIWNALNTFVRVPVAALLSFGATQHLSPGAQLVATILGGTIALIAHGSKIAIRTATTPSPEPISNTALSLGEDVAAVGLTWLATQHPIIAGVIVTVCLILAILAVRYIVRSAKSFFRQARSSVHQFRAQLTRTSTSTD